MGNYYFPCAIVPCSARTAEIREVLFMLTYFHFYH